MPITIPNDVRKKRLTKIQAKLALHKSEQNIQALAEAVKLMLDEPEFQQHVKRSPTLSKAVAGEGDLLRLAWAFLYKQLHDKDFVAAAMILWDRETFCAEPRCVQLLWNALLTKRMICVIGGGGLGKCLGPEVPVMMFDGSTKAAKDIVVGDVLMGDDSTPRKVLQANAGHGPMYRIIPERGAPWTCNDEHILSLKCAYDRTNGNGSLSSKWYKGNVIDVPLKEYVGWSKTKKNQCLQFHVGADFTEQAVPYDPYIYGLWLGDGGWDTPAIHKPFGPITDYWADYFSKLGFRISIGYEDTPCPMVSCRGQAGAPNPFTGFIRTSVKNREKFIRKDYLVNSRENRIKLLAGLLDTDGYVTGTGYEITSKWESLARQIVWLARSLGFAATVKPSVKSIKSIGFSATYWRVYISGHGLNELPVLQKKAQASTSLKSMTSTSFQVEPIGDGDFYGFVIDGNRRFLLGDFTVTHNTYSPSAYFLLQYIIDPEWTRVQIGSASEDHLKSNLFADFGRLFNDASMALPGKHDSESISLDKKRRQGVWTLTLPGGANGKSKIKGSHTKPRPQHPLFGRRSRVFCLLDESQELPENVFDEIGNRFSTVVADDVEHLKFLVSANPRDIFSKFGQIAKPIGGWETINRDTETWESEKGWTVISLDQTKHENYIAKKPVFPGFATYDGVQIRLRDCDGNWEDPRMYTFVYGKFPPQGTTFAVIKQRHLLASEGEWIFRDSVNGLAGMDPAFTSDRPAFAAGRVGMAIGWRDSAGTEHKLPKPKMAIQLDQVVVLPHGDSQDLADEVMARLKDLGVKPSGFGIDQTGVGRGTADIIRRQWTQKIGPLPEGFGGESAAIHGIEYGGAPTTVKIADEDTKTPKERFDRIATELWYGAATLFEFDTIRIGNGVDLRVVGELAARKGDMQPGVGQKLTVETKDAYKKRTKGDSPDLADATLIMIHAARMSIAGILPKAKDTVQIVEGARNGEWHGFNQSFGTAELAGFGGAGVEVDFMKD